MTKKLKIGLISVLSVFFVLCTVLLCLPPSTALAKSTDTTDTLATDGFKFRPGASIQLADKFGDDLFLQPQKTMAFEFDVTDARKTNVLSLNTKYPSNRIWPEVDGCYPLNDSYTYTFTLYRDNGDGKTAVALSEWIINARYMYPGNTGDLCVKYTVAKKQLSNGTQIKDISGLAPYEKNWTKKQAKMTWDYNEYTFVSAGYIKHGNVFDVDNVIRLQLTVDSPYSSYFVKFNYKYKTASKNNVFGVEYNDVRTGSCQSDVRSISGILKEMDQAGDIETVFETEEKINHAYEILNNTETSRVRVKYLERIGDTPFATPVYAWVNVPIVDNKVYIDDVCKALDVHTLNCLGSVCQNLIYDDGAGAYVAKYLKDIWVEAYTTTEEHMSYYLDINVSFEKYFYGLVQDGIFSPEAYEYTYNVHLLKAYPELQEYDIDDIYGLFGLVVLPTSYTPSAFYEAFFGEDGTYNSENLKKMHHFAGELSSASYSKLLKDYDYAFLARVWNEYFNNLTDVEPATYVLLYAVPGETAGEIGQGDKDHDKPLKELFNMYIQNNNDNGGIAVIVGVIVAVLAVGVVVYVVKKKNKKNKKRSK